jgi:hypothetical protein
MFALEIMNRMDFVHKRADMRVRSTLYRSECKPHGITNQEKGGSETV